MPRKPPTGRRFQKGVSGNPRGAQLHNPVKREFKHLTEEQLREVLSMILKTHPCDISEITAKADTVLKAWVGNAAIAGMNNGDLGPLMQILDRVLGRIKERIEVSRLVSNLTEEELDARIKELTEIINLK